MPPIITTNGWERWRGEQDTLAREFRFDLQKLLAWQEAHNLKHERITEEITVLKTKLVIFAAIAAALGGAIPAIAAAIFK